MANEKVSDAINQVEAYMKKLAITEVSEDFCFEYLFLVRDVMKIYDEYSKAIDLEDEDKILDYADRIISQIDLEIEEGILKK